MADIKKGDLVTFNTEYKFSKFSNTYRVTEQLSDNRCLLSHPLAPEVYIIKAETELNHSMASLKSSEEKALEFIDKYKNMLSYTDRADLEALCIYFIVRKELTNKHKSTILAQCGKVGSKLLQQSISSAISLINQNLPLLDEFTRIMFNSHKGIFSDPDKIETKKQRYAVFSIAGFLMAQLDDTY